MIDDYIDTTSDNTLEHAEIPDSAVSSPPSKQDPALAVVVALANELQTAYANDQSKLAAANRTLRAATNIQPHH